MRAVLALLVAILIQIGWESDERIPMRPDRAQALVDSLARQYYQAKLSFYPAYAASQGIDASDQHLTTYSRRSVGGFLRKIKRLETELGKFVEDSLSLEGWVDLKILQADMAEQVLLLGDLEIWRSWPTVYTTSCIGGIYCLLGPQTEDASRKLAQRLAEIPAVVAAARDNLDHPVRLHCQEASRALTLFLPWLQGLAEIQDQAVVDQALLAEAAGSLAGFRVYLDSLAVNASTDFALGSDRLGQLLLEAHLINDSPPDLVAYAQWALAKSKSRLETLGSATSPEAANTPVALTGQELLEQFRAQTESARVFLQKKDLMGLPPEPPLVFRQAPALLESLAGRCLYQGPGSFWDRHGGVLYIPVPDSEDLDKTDLMFPEESQRHGLAAIVSRWLYPGKHLLSECSRRQASLIRRMSPDPLTLEGWGGYCLEMMAQQGFDGLSDMRQVWESDLLYAAMMVAELKLQMGDFSLDEAVGFVVGEAGAPWDTVDRDLRWALTMEPLRPIGYIVGKRDIMELRGQIERIMGDSFTLRGFHDNLLGCGSPPLYLLRRCVISSS